MIKKIHACNKMNSSINVNEVIRAVLNSLFFLKKKIFAQTKSINSTKSTKRTKGTKNTKTQTSKKPKSTKS